MSRDEHGRSEKRLTHDLARRAFCFGGDMEMAVDIPGQQVRRVPGRGAWEPDRDRAVSMICCVTVCETRSGRATTGAPCARARSVGTRSGSERRGNVLHPQRFLRFAACHRGRGDGVSGATTRATDLEVSIKGDRKLSPEHWPASSRTHAPPPPRRHTHLPTLGASYCFVYCNPSQKNRGKRANPITTRNHDK
jgi:hypothetical protein